MLTPHYLAAYYMLVGAALLTLWLVFLDPERLRNRSPIVPLLMTALAVAVGLGIAAVELLPVQHMVAYTPRAVGGDSGGYDYASSWGMSPVELMSTILPQFNGMLEHYWGQNPFKGSHRVCLGALVVVLAIFGIPAARSRRMLLPLGGIAVLFTIVAWGGYSPLYHLWYLLPKISQFRAPGLAFFMTALVTCVVAGFGVDRLLDGLVTRRTLFTVLGVLGVVALLAAGGLLQGVAESLADARTCCRLLRRTHPNCRVVGSASLIVVVAGRRPALPRPEQVAARAGGARGTRRCRGPEITGQFSGISPGGFRRGRSRLADDVLTTAMKKASPMPFPGHTVRVRLKSLHDPQIDVLGVYRASALMARGVPTLLGYHGMESRFFDALLGVKNIWRYQFSPNIWDLYAVKYVIETQEPVGTPGYHKALGPTQLDDVTGLDLAPGQELTAIVEERDSTPRWVRVVPAAVKVPEEQIAPTVSNNGFPYNTYALYPDSTSTKAVTPTSGMPTPAPTSVGGLAFIVATWRDDGQARRQRYADHVSARGRELVS